MLETSSLIVIQSCRFTVILLLLSLLLLPLLLSSRRGQGCVGGTDGYSMAMGEGIVMEKCRAREDSESSHRHSVM